MSNASPSESGDGKSQPAAVADARIVTLALLAARKQGATVCPSEVARALVLDRRTTTGQEDWRAAMPLVHAAVDRLVDEDRVRLSWRGKTMPRRAGPYRIGRVGRG